MLSSRFWILFGILAVLSPLSAFACTIPVFRYALDRWEPDRFRLLLPAQSAQDTALADLLRPLRANGKANLDIHTAIDPSELKTKLFDSKTGEDVLWTGNLQAATLPALLDSPARGEIKKRILAGESVIWVLVSSGEAEDEANMQRIEKRLSFLEQVAALPIQDPNDPDSQLGPGPALKLEFTSLRLSASDTGEAQLIRQLRGPESRLAGKPGGFAAAVFGRGRVLGSWALSELDDATLEEACMFLVGRCSCRVKNENPGWDILMNVNWEDELKNVPKSTETDLEEKNTPSAGKTEMAQKSAQEAETATESSSTPKKAPALISVKTTETSKTSPQPTSKPSSGHYWIGALFFALAALFFLKKG